MKEIKESMKRARLFNRLSVIIAISIVPTIVIGILIGCNPVVISLITLVLVLGYFALDHAWVVEVLRHRWDD